MSCEIKIQLPEYLQSIHNNKYVYIDKEIVNVIKQLWKYNIVTLGICNGHRPNEKPSLVVDNVHSTNDIAKIRDIIHEVDNRSWCVYQWKLTEV